MSLTLLGVVIFCSLGGVLLTLLPDAETGRVALMPLTGFLGMILVSLSSMAMIWFRPRGRPASAWLGVGVVFWFVGLILVAWGMVIFVTPADGGLAEDLGWGTIFCFGPGGLLALLGLVLYALDRRGGWPLEVVVEPEADRWLGEADPVRDRLRRADEYRTHIVQLIRQESGSPLGDQVSSVGARLDEWMDYLGRLGERLQAYRANTILQRDTRELPLDIQQLEDRLQEETDPALVAQMNETLTSYQEQSDQLEALASLMRRTELEMDETLAEIGSIYSPLQLIGAREVDSQRARRISTEVEEQTMRLGELLDAMAEVYAEQAGSQGAEPPH